MEGDAGASRLNPIDEDNSLGTEVKDEDSTESRSGADPISSEVTAEDSDESKAGADPISDGVSSEAEESELGDPDSEDPDSEEPAQSVESPESGAQRRPSRLAGRAWLAGIAAILLIFAAAIGGGGYYALRSHQDIQALHRNSATALSIAKDCVGATQAPDTSSMAASEQKIIDCGTDQYRTQALLYSSMLVQAYQAANVHLKVSDLRAAVEHNNPDGSVDVLVALRVNLSNDQQQNQETGYRLRVRMAPIDGTYKISKLDQVTK
jgi:Mce-associated membrane protein